MSVLVWNFTALKWRKTFQGGKSNVAFLFVCIYTIRGVYFSVFNCSDVPLLIQSVWKHNITAETWKAMKQRDNDIVHLWNQVCLIKPRTRTCVCVCLSLSLCVCVCVCVWIFPCSLIFIVRSHNDIMFPLKCTNLLTEHTHTHTHTFTLSKVREGDLKLKVLVRCFGEKTTLQYYRNLFFCSRLLVQSLLHNIDILIFFIKPVSVSAATANTLANPNAFMIWNECKQDTTSVH